MQTLQHRGGYIEFEGEGWYADSVEHTDAGQEVVGRLIADKDTDSSMVNWAARSVGRGTPYYLTNAEAGQLCPAS